MSHTSGDRIGCPRRVLNVRPTFLEPSRRPKGARPEVLSAGDVRDETGTGFPPDRHPWRRFLAELWRRAGVTFAIFVWLAVLSGCVTSGTRIDPRDFAVSSCDLTPQQFALAQTRAREYLNRYPSAAGDVRFVAVIADSVFPSEVSDLWVKLGRSQTSSSAYLQRRGQTFRLWCVAVLDRSTLIPVTNQGYLLANTPARGEVVHLGGRIVLYLGRGI
jgi:hypothetical protein